MDPDKRSSILVVDDAPENLRLLATILKRGSLVARPVPSGKLAIEAALIDPPDLVLLDVNMPGMSGLDLCRWFKQDERLRSIPIIFISGLHGTEDKVHAFRAGGVDYISKPFQEQEVLARVKTHLELRTLQSELESRNLQLSLDQRRTNERLEALSRVARDALIMLDNDGAISHWNEAAEEMFGWSRADALGQNLHTLLAPSRFHEPYQTAFEQFRTTGQGAIVGKTQEFAARRKSGEEFPVEISLAAAQLDNRWCAVAVVRDVTERKRAESALVFGNLLMTTQREAMLDGMLVVDGEGKIISHNGAFVEMWGISQELLASKSDARVVGSVLEKLVAPEQFVEKVTWLYQHPMERSRDEIALKDGRTFDRFSAPMAAQDGKNYGRVWFFRDISDRKRDEDALRQSEARYRASFEGASVGQALNGSDGRFLQVNRTFAALLGYEEHELCGKTFSDVTHPEDRQASLDAIGELLRGECATQRMEKRYLCKDGRIQWADVSIALLRDSTGKPTQFVAHVTDISARKQAEAELKQAVAARQKVELDLMHSQKLEAVGQLASGIAHEINTPTQFIGDSVHFIKEAFDGIATLLPRYRAALGASSAGRNERQLLEEIEAIEREIDLEDLIQNVPPSLERCIDGTSRIASIVRSMKEFAHSDQHEQSPADINRAIEATLTIARHEYKYVADIEKNFSELPPIVCHLGGLNQVFLNLIVNAAHAIEAVVKDSGTKGRICISTRREGDLVRVDVADSGSGIPESVRRRIFEPFFTTKPVGKGTGQGLAIARSIVVDRHGGTLDFETALGKGTTFTIRLPIQGTTRPSDAKER